MVMIFCVTLALNICGAKGDWTMDNFIEMQIKQIREKVGDKRVLLGLSGGVDSSVVGVLLQKAIGDQLICIFCRPRSSP